VAGSTNRAAKHNKLRKSRPDGYESDGGYVNDRVGSTKEKKSSKKDKAGLGDYTSDGEAVTGKKNKKKNKTQKDTSLDGEVSDGGYLSEASGKKKKKSFFRRNKSKPQQLQERKFIPPLPQSSLLSHPISDKFSNRSTTPSTFAESSKTSFTEISDTSRSATPTATRSSREEPTAMLTQAFKEDAQSITGSVDWSNAYSHFPRMIRSPQPRLPGTLSEPPAPRPANTAPVIVSGHPRQLRTKPSPLLLSPVPSDYGHASDASPVPSETATITQDPKSTGSVQRSLLEATAAPDISWKSPNGSTWTPSPNDVSPSSDYVVPYPNSPLVPPGGTLRPRALANYDLPPPSPPPSGPLPRLPPLPEPGMSGMKPSRLGIGTSSAIPFPARLASPGLTVLRGKESPFPSSPAIIASKQLQHKASFSAEPSDKRGQQLSDLQAPFSKSLSETGETGAPSLIPRRQPRPPEIHIDAASDDGRSELISKPDNNSVSSVVRNGHIATEEDGYLDMESDLEYENNVPVADVSSVWNRAAFSGGEKSVEPRSKFVENVEAIYNQDGRDRSKMVGRTAPNAPPRPVRSILRKSTSRS
jgi:hypothetical protein